MNLTIRAYFILLLLSLFSCKSDTFTDKSVTSIEKIDLSTILETYHQDYLKLNPLNATFAGDSRYNDVFPNFNSKEYLKEYQTFYEKTLQTLAEIDKNQLSENDKMSYSILKWDCEIALQELEGRYELTPIDQMWSANLMVGQLASGASAQPFVTPEDYDNWLKRVDGYLAWCNSAIDNMRTGMKEGIVLPKALITKVIPQFADMGTGTVKDHLFFKPISNMPVDFSSEDKDRLTTAYTTMVKDKIIPTYAKMATFFEEEYLPAGRSTSGIEAYANGEQLYQNRIQKYTTTDMTADEIHELGLQEVARLRSEMEKVKKEIGFEGDLKAFFDYVRSKKELMPFTDPQQVIDNFNAIHKKMLPQLDKLFDLRPKTPFEVRRTEAFREASASAEYNQGSLDGTRPGVFYVPIPDVTKYNTYSDEDLFLHEAIPGHHYQISLQQENTELPSFRKTLWYSAYGEGWALYCESLGKELGLYQDPYQYFGMLGAEMHRAIRLVVDSGIHSKGWTREKAIQYSLDNEAESEASITAEIERYMANPGQALSYKIGQLKIMELRAKAEANLGKDFDIKVFHEKVLEVGCVPLALLEEKIMNWISTNTKA